MMNFDDKNDPLASILPAKREPKFRPISEDELGLLMEVQNAGHEFPWSEGVTRDCILAGYDCWFIEYNNKVVGYGIASFPGDGNFHVLNICVLPTERGKGYGRRIMNHLLMIGYVRGALKSLLEVRQSSKNVIALYQSLGYDIVGERADYYPAHEGREAAFLMELDFDTYQPEAL